MAEKRVFDRSLGFMFAPEWYETIKTLEEEVSPEAAVALVKSICEYALYNTAPDFNNKHCKPWKLAWIAIKTRIDGSTEFRRNRIENPTKK